MPRYFFQIVVILGDVAIIAAVAFVLYLEPLNVLVWIIVVLTFQSWNGQGGFIAWNPKSIKAFFQNAKKLGL